MERPETLDDVILSCVPKSRAISSPELWERVERLCKRLGIIPIPSAVKAGCLKLIADGRITRKEPGVVKT